jgi:3-deoxy-D-manno-octulosonic-acid transferase
MLYSVGLFIFSLIYLPALIFKGKFHAEFGERFAIFDSMKKKALLSRRNRIWIQAVSVGEVTLCKSLVALLKERFPGQDIVISTITKAGNDLAKKIFAKDAVIIYFPLDFLFFVKKTISLIKPALYIMIETEIWPNTLRELSSKGIPSALVNGRISDRSIGKYRLVKPFLKRTLGYINVFCMQDNIDAERIIGLGAPAKRVKVTGNMKFDAEVSTGIKDLQSIRASLGLRRDEDLFVAGSTHEGEEEILLDTFKNLSGDFSRLRLLIAPRHVQRVCQIEKIIRDAGFEPVKFSAIDDKQQTTNGIRNTKYERRIILLDTIGHLNETYSAATIVFIGGSLVKHGGHNPIEPASFAKPILFGLYMFNFKYITNVFLRNKAAIQVFDKEDLYEKCKLLLNDVNTRDMLGQCAKRSVAENRGATGRNVAQIRAIIR